MLPPKLLPHKVTLCKWDLTVERYSTGTGLLAHKIHAENNAKLNWICLPVYDPYHPLPCTSMFLSKSTWSVDSWTLILYKFSTFGATVAPQIYIFSYSFKGCEPCRFSQHSIFLPLIGLTKMITSFFLNHCSLRCRYNSMVLEQFLGFRPCGSREL